MTRFVCGRQASRGHGETADESGPSGSSEGHEPVEAVVGLSSRRRDGSRAVIVPRRG